MIFVHNGDKEIFGYHNRSYNYFCKGNYNTDTCSRDYRWKDYIVDGTLTQLAPTNMWRW